MADFMTNYFGPLDKSSCVYFLIISVIFFKPTTAGSCNPCATNAICEVLLPTSTTNPAQRFSLSTTVSEGLNVCETTI